MNIKRTVQFIFNLAITGLVIAGCSKKTGNQARNTNPAVPVVVVQVTTTNIPVRISAIGNVLAFSSVSIRSQVTGQLRDVHFKEGQEVKKGDLLFTIDPRSFEAALRQAQADSARDEAQLQNLQMQFEREKKLFDQQVASQEEFDNAKAALISQQGIMQADMAGITNASLNLEYTAIRSPVDGVIGAQLVYPGNVIKSEDDAMAMVNQVQPISVAFFVPQQYLPEIKREMRSGALRIDVTFDNMEGDPITGDLTFIDNAVDPNTATIQLKGTFGNDDHRLWPGQFVRVELTLQRLPNAVVVPSQAVLTGQNGQYTYVVKDDQTVDQRTILTGTAYNGMTVIEKGLAASEKVVIDGQMRLVPGAKVAMNTHTNTAPPVTQ